jgi:hypothetical protein
MRLVRLAVMNTGMKTDAANKRARCALRRLKAMRVADTDRDSREVRDEQEQRCHQVLDREPQCQNS